MPGTRDIRHRIKSIKSTRQITKAMELVSVAKMRKAQQQALATRTYSRLAWQLIQELSPKTDPRIHKLLRKSPTVSKAALVLITSNRGLIGGFNNHLIHAALDYAKAIPEVEFITLGKKGREAVRKRGHRLVAEFEKKDFAILLQNIRPLAKLLTEDFVTGKYDSVVLIYMDFVNTLLQKPHSLELLPLGREPDKTLGEVGISYEEDVNFEANLDYIFEPSASEVFEILLPRLVEMQIFQALLETNASEHSARMIAMKNASDAAGELIDELILEYNQLRQAGITKEISEIVAGSLALNSR